MSYQFQRATEAQIQEMLWWQYEPPYDIYTIATADMDEAEVMGEVEYFLDPATNCYSLSDEEGHLLAVATFGPDGRVPGGDYSAEAVDIGLAVKPELTGHGRGSSFVQAVIAFARETFHPPMLRVTIAEFNTRAQRVWQKEGFVEVDRFVSAHWTERPFLIMVKVGD